MKKSLIFTALLTLPCVQAASVFTHDGGANPWVQSNATDAPTDPDTLAPSNDFTASFTVAGNVNASGIAGPGGDEGIDYDYPDAFAFSSTHSPGTTSADRTQLIAPITVYNSATDTYTNTTLNANMRIQIVGDSNEVRFYRRGDFFDLHVTGTGVQSITVTTDYIQPNTDPRFAPGITGFDLRLDDDRDGRLRPVMSVANVGVRDNILYSLTAQTASYIPASNTWGASSADNFAATDFHDGNLIFYTPRSAAPVIAGTTATLDVTGRRRQALFYHNGGDLGDVVTQTVTTIAPTAASGDADIVSGAIFTFSIDGMAATVIPEPSVSLFNLTGLAIGVFYRKRKN